MAIRSSLFVTAAIATLIFPIAAFAADAIPKNISDALVNPGRPRTENQLDAKLKPDAVLAFAGVKTGMTAADLVPEGGYYTRLLSGAVGPKGAVYMVVPAAGMGQDRNGPVVKDPTQPMPLSRIEVARSVVDQPEFHNADVYWLGLGTGGGFFALPKQLDIVLTSGGYHVLKGAPYAKLDMGGVDKAIFRAMKNNGVFAVIDNAANKGAGFTAAESLDRVEPAAVIAEVTAAGFTLDGQSDALALADDDHSKPADGSMPADMFVLRFRKPANAENTDKRPGVDTMSGYFGNTRRGNVDAKNERRVLYHPDMTYQEMGTREAGGEMFQTGNWFFSADGGVCMHHLFPIRSRGLVNCSVGTAINKKAGDHWTAGGNVGDSEIVKGYVYFDN